MPTKKNIVKMIDAVAAIFIRTLPSGERQCLLGRRPFGKIFAGYWEFPGGKIENGETASLAIRREIFEELSVDIIRFYPWIKVVNHYPHGQVNLQFFIVEEWENQISQNIHQALHWQNIDDLDSLPKPLLLSNEKLIRYLQLPSTMYITNAEEDGWQSTIDKVKLAIYKGARFFQIRDKSYQYRENLIKELAAIIIPQGGEIILNDNIDLAEKYRDQICGMHLSSYSLNKYFRNQTSLPTNFKWRGASVHDQDELNQAVAVGCDYVLLGNVLSTLSHPDKKGLGWSEFANLVASAPIPVYAIGGMNLENEIIARSNGAHGSARLRSW